MQLQGASARKGYSVPHKLADEFMTYMLMKLGPDGTVMQAKVWLAGSQREFAAWLERQDVAGPKCGGGAS